MEGGERMEKGLGFLFLLLRDLPILKNSAERKWLYIQKKGKGLSCRAWPLSRLALMGPK